MPEVCIARSAWVVPVETGCGSLDFTGAFSVSLSLCKTSGCGCAVFITVKVKLVVAVALHSCDATADSALVDFDLWFRTKSDRAEDESQFRRADSDDTIWFVALAKEQLALVAENGLHSSLMV